MESAADVTPAELRVLARTLESDDKLLCALAVCAAQVSGSPGAGTLTVALDDADLGRMVRLAATNRIAERVFLRCMPMLGGAASPRGAACSSDHAWPGDMTPFFVFNVAHATALNLKPDERKRIHMVNLGAAGASELYAKTATTPDQVRAFFSLRPLLHRMRVLLLPADAALAEALLDAVLETPSQLVALQVNSLRDATAARGAAARRRCAVDTSLSFEKLFSVFHDFHVLG
jgi:hypothetical protein